MNDSLSTFSFSVDGIRAVREKWNSDAPRCIEPRCSSGIWTHNHLVDPRFTEPLNHSGTDQYPVDDQGVAKNNYQSEDNMQTHQEIQDSSLAANRKYKFNDRPRVWKWDL